MGQPIGDTRGPPPMEANGAYGRNARMQADGGAAGRDYIAAAFARFAPPSGPVVLADYGASHGINSLAPMAVALAQVRARCGAGHPVQVCHVDQPDNDFASLFRLLRDAPDSYAAGDAACFPMAVGRSFYIPVLPPGSVSFGWCAYAVHWLSRSPVDTADHVLPRLASPAVRAAFAERSAKDWRAFLSARAGELRPGAGLVVVQPCLPEVVATTFPVLMPWVREELEVMAAGGAITPGELGRMTILVYERSPAEIRAPFQEAPFEGLRIADERLVEQPDPFWSAFAASGDVEALARAYWGFFRAPFGPSLLAGLAPSRDGAFRAAFLARLEAGILERVRAFRAPVLRDLFIHIARLERT